MCPTKKWMQSLKNLESNMKCSLISMESSPGNTVIFTVLHKQQDFQQVFPSTNLGPSGYPRIHGNPMLCSLFPPSHRVALSWLSPIFCKIPLILLVISHYIPIISSFYTDRIVLYQAIPIRIAELGFQLYLHNQSPINPQSISIYCWV